MDVMKIMQVVKILQFLHYFLIILHLGPKCEYFIMNNDGAVKIK